MRGWKQPYYRAINEKMVELDYEMLTIEVVVSVIMVFDVMGQIDMIWRLRNI